MKVIKNSWPITALLLVSLVLAFLNYQPGTWLSGWDNLHPEFNFPLDIGRSLNAAWQEYRGPGLLGGMAHAADLPRQLILWGFSLLLPVSFLRYFWTFLMLTLGPLGAYTLSYQTLLKRFSPTTRRFAAFSAGLFYLLNLSTIQTFYIPFETFTTFYGFLPWLLFCFLAYLQKPQTETLLLLVVTLLLSAPAFYVQTLFLVFLICLTPLLIPFLIKRTRLVPLLISLTALLLTQAYWLFPAAYFSLSSASITVNATQNLVATPETIDRNQEYGDFRNVALLKGFSFSYADLNPNHQYQLLLGPWVSHLNNPAIQLLGFALFALVLFGLFFAFKNKLPYRFPLAFIFLICLFFLINDNPPTGPLYRYLQDHLTLFYQSFRSVFTKWSIPASLLYSLFFSVGVVNLFHLFTAFGRRTTLLLTTFTLAFALLSFSGPAFSGHLLYPSIQVNFPSAYFDLFNFMQTQPHHTRIANFPQHSFWGWQFNSWGYRGSGFLWYGLNQPILDRAFDVWSPYSQQYYDEIKFALYGQNLPLLETLLEKYSVQWLLVDRSVINPGSTDTTPLFFDQTAKLFRSSSKIKLAKTFDFLDLYSVNLQTQPQDFLSTTTVSLTRTPQVAQPRAVITDTPQDNRSSLGNESKNCDAFRTGPHQKSIEQDYVYYASVNANLCDHFLYPELKLDRLYQIKIEHQNIAGQPFLYCLEPYSVKTCLRYGYLPSGTGWQTSTITLPPLSSSNYGFTLHLFNYSLGPINTANAWRKITVSPVPQITQTRLEPSTPLSSTSHPAYSLYTASLTSSEPTPLILNQGFDPGWKVFLVNEKYLSRPLYQQYLQSLLLVPLPESLHQVANGWANSWTIPPGTHHLLIVYLPQHFQFLGFALLLFLPLLFLLQSRRK